MSFTPARMIAYAGRAWRTSRESRARISTAVWPLMPRFSTVQSGWDCIIQYAYWLSGFPSPFGGDSSGERKPGVPAVVESPRPTIVTDRGRIGGGSRFELNSLTVPTLQDPLLRSPPRELFSRG